MMTLRRIMEFGRRLWHGEDVIFIRQDKRRWNEQFAYGRWDYLLLGHPNMTLLAGLLSQQAAQSGTRLRVLDIGCGNGALAVSISKMQDMIGYHGIDISEDALKQARILVPGASFSVEDAEHPSATLGTFDVLIFSEVVYYMAPSMLDSYRTYAHGHTIILVSVVRSWRSFFIWRRIHRQIEINKSFVVSDKKTGHTFDIVVGHFV